NYYQEGAERTVAALINAIHAEGRANRKEEKREDRGKKFIDGITLVVLICTLVALVLTYFAIRKQVDEMKRVYDPIEKQARAAITDERPWIGSPVDIQQVDHVTP